MNASRTEPERFPKLAVCAPCYNEAESVRSVVQEWLTVLYELAEPFEIIVVDDGSTDGTLEVLLELADSDARILVLRYDENQGYGVALSAAVSASRAEWVLTIDSDGQFSLSDLPQMLELARQTGADVVSGVRKKNDPRASARAGDWILRVMTKLLYGCKARDPQCAMKLWRGELVRTIASKVEPAGVLTPTLWCLAAQRLGARIENLPVAHFKRRGGEPKIEPTKEAPSVLKQLFGMRSVLNQLKAPRE